MKIGRYVVDELLHTDSVGGKLYSASNPSSAETLLLKCIPIMPATAAAIEEIVRDIRVMSTIAHPYMVRFVDTFVTEATPSSLW